MAAENTANCLKEYDISDLVTILNDVNRYGFSAATKTSKLGLNLGLLKSTLDVIEAQHSDPGRRLEEVLASWLRKQDKVNENGGTTIEVLVTALEKTGEIAVAEKFCAVDTGIPHLTDTRRPHSAVSETPQHAKSSYRLISLTTADGSTSVHKAVPLIYPNNRTYDGASNRLTPNGEERSSLCICPVGMELLANIHKPIAVLSIAGPARTGKSYILSRLLDSHDAFELGHSVNAQTHGIWIGTQALEYDDHVLILLDTEGICAVSADGTNDAKILVMTLLMSSYFIYNSSGVPRTDDLNKMRMFTTLTQYFAQQERKYDNDENALQECCPSFLWLLRDLMQKLEDTQTGKEMTPTEYLLKVVLRADDTEHNKVKMAILNFFRSHKCFVLPSPSADCNVLHDITVRYEELTKKFKSGVTELISHLRSSVTTKKGFQSRQPIDGRTLALLAEKYIEALNTPGAVLHLDDTWAAVAKVKCWEIQNELVEKYQVQMEQAIAEASESGRLPLEVITCTKEDTDTFVCHTIMGIHHFIYGQLQEELIKKLVLFVPENLEEKREEFEKKLVFRDQRKIKGGAVMDFLQENEKRSKVFCKEVWDEIYQPIKEQIPSADYTYEQYVVDFDEVCETYFLLARGPAKWAVLNEAREQEKQRIKEMKGYDDELNEKLEEIKGHEQMKQLIAEEIYEMQTQRDEDVEWIKRTLKFLQDQNHARQQYDQEMTDTIRKQDETLKRIIDGLEERAMAKKENDGLKVKVQEQEQKLRTIEETLQLKKNEVSFRNLGMTMARRLKSSFQKSGEFKECQNGDRNDQNRQ